MDIERYSHVMHIVFDVVGQLRRRHDALDALRACFPAGTLTGAPKIRAMEIIEELEPTGAAPTAARSATSSFAGNLDIGDHDPHAWSSRRATRLHAGRRGIVADSDPAAEYEETREQGARACSTALELAQHGEDR